MNGRVGEDACVENDLFAIINVEQRITPTGAPPLVKQRNYETR